MMFIIYRMVQINLTSAQIKKAMKGHAVQIPHHQLVNNSGEHAVDLDFDKKTISRIRRNAVNGKGFRIPKGLMNAGAKLAQQGAHKLADYAVNEGANRLNSAIQKSQYIPNEYKGVAKQASKRALNASKKFAMSRLDDQFDHLQVEGFFQDVGRALKPIAKIAIPLGKTVAKTVLPTVATMAGNYVGGPIAGKIAGDLATQGVKGLGVGRMKKGSAEAKAHMARIRAMRNSKGSGFFNIAKSVAKAAAPTLIKAGSKMATDALINHVNGEGLYKQVKQTKVGKMPKKIKRGKVVNPRITPQYRTLINGIDQVEAGVNPVQGGSFAGWNYA